MCVPVVVVAMVSTRLPAVAATPKRTSDEPAQSDATEEAPLCWWQVQGGVRPSVRGTLHSARATVQESDPTAIRSPRPNNGFVPSPPKGKRAPALDAEMWEERMSMQYLRPYWVHKRTRETSWDRGAQPIETFESGPPTPPVQSQKPSPARLLPRDPSWHGTVNAADTPFRLLAAIAQSSQPSDRPAPDAAGGGGGGVGGGGGGGGGGDAKSFQANALVGVAVSKLLKACHEAEVRRCDMEAEATAAAEAALASAVALALSTADTAKMGGDERYGAYC